MRTVPLTLALAIAPALALVSCASPPPSLPPAPPSPLTNLAPPPSAIAPAESDAGPSAALPVAPVPALKLTSKPIPLPGATGPVSLDYLASDRTAGRVWIPAGGTGSVDVLDVASGKLTRIEGFATVEREMRGQKRVMGPSSATIGDGVVYAGNRATSEVCAIDAAKLTKGACLKLPVSPDGLQYVAGKKELWVTTPKDNSLTVLDASTPAKLKMKAKVTLDGSPEGYAVDDAHGVFYTNLEDKNKTVAIDTTTHKVTSTWQPGCGQDGPRGLAIDTARGFLFVACTDHLEALDIAHAGALLSKLDTGAGVDNIDYLDARGRVYVVSGKTATLTVVQVDDKGILSAVVTAPTSDGTRVVVADRDGTAYVADGAQGRVLALSPSP